MHCIFLNSGTAFNSNILLILIPLVCFGSVIIKPIMSAVYEKHYTCLPIIKYGSDDEETVVGSNGNFSGSMQISFPQRHNHNKETNRAAKTTT